MLHTLFLAAVLVDDTQLAAVELKSTIVAASVFKPGVALIVRQVTVPAGKKKYKLDILPDILDGSFWYGASDGVQIGDVQTKLRFEEKVIVTEASSIAEYLLANIGKEVKLKVQVTKGNQVSEEAVQGTILGSGQANSNTITLRLANDNLRSIYSSSILELETKGLRSKLERTVPSILQQIDFDIDAKKAGTIRFVTLENGAAWSGSYLVDLAEAEKAKVSAKAELVVGSLTFEDTDVQVLAGMPSLPQTPKYDLASGFGSMIAWLKGTQETYRNYRQGSRDPYSMIAKVMQDAQIRARFVAADGNYFGGLGGGGFGGGQGGYIGDYGGTQDLDSQSGGMYGRPGSESGNPTESAARVEDLYSYPLGKISMAPGDRLTRQLLDQSAGYERLYRWEIANQQLQQYQPPVERSRVVKILRLQNRSKLPWTGGKALVLKDGSPLAQTDMPFTAAGQDANLELGEVQDIPVSKDAKEVKREQVNLYQRSFTAITVETKLTIENTRSEPLKIEVRYDLNGDVLLAEGAAIKALGTALNATNKNTRVTWTVTLMPGEKRELTMTSKTLV